jgi:multidrug transporter EmrE-like cation transporter
MMSKWPVIAPLLLVVSGSLLYHIAAKSVPRTLEPFAALIGVYATALAASALAYAFARRGVLPAHLSSLWHPTVAAVGIGALMIELGFLLTYRAAWPVSIASVMTNGIVAVLLIPTGALLFSEPITAIRVAGVILCLAGLSLMQR